MSAKKILDPTSGSGLGWRCSNLEGYEAERNHKFRFRTILSGSDTAATRLRRPFKAGNRTLRSLTAVGGCFFALNPELVTGHMQIKTCRALLRSVLGLGHARKLPSHRPTGKDNDRALNVSGWKFCKVHPSSRDSLGGHECVASQEHSEPCGFLFLFHLWAGASLWLLRVALLFLGGIPLFLLFRFCFNVPIY